MVKEITVTFDDGSLGRFSQEYANLGRVGLQIKEIPGYQYRATDGTWGPVTPHPTMDEGHIEDKPVVPDDDDFDTPYKTKFLHDERERLLKENAKLRQVIEFILGEVL